MTAVKKSVSFSTSLANQMEGQTISGADLNETALWKRLPSDIWSEVFEHASDKDIHSAMQLNKQLRYIAMHTDKGHLFLHLVLAKNASIGKHQAVEALLNLRTNTVWVDPSFVYPKSDLKWLLDRTFRGICQDGHHQVLEAIIRRHNCDVQVEEQCRSVTFGSDEIHPGDQVDKPANSLEHLSFKLPRVSAIVIAAISGHTKVVKILLQQSGNETWVDLNRALLIASRNGHFQVVELILQNKNYPQANHLESTETETSETTIQGVTASFCGNSAIHFAAYNGHKTVVMLLLEENTLDVPFYVRWTINWTCRMEWMLLTRFLLTRDQKYARYALEHGHGYLGGILFWVSRAANLVFGAKVFQIGLAILVCHLMAPDRYDPLTRYVLTVFQLYIGFVPIRREIHNVSPRLAQIGTLILGGGALILGAVTLFLFFIIDWEDSLEY